MRIVVGKNSSGAAQAVYVGDNGDDALAAAANALRADPALRFFQTVNPPLLPLRLPVEATVRSAEFIPPAPERGIHSAAPGEPKKAKTKTP